MMRRFVVSARSHQWPIRSTPWLRRSFGSKEEGDGGGGGSRAGGGVAEEEEEQLRRQAALRFGRSPAAPSRPTRPTRPAVNPGGEHDTDLDEVLKVWEENGYVDYMSHQRDKGWKT